MIDIVSLHTDDDDKLVLMIFHDVRLIGYSVNEKDSELTIHYHHTRNEANCTKDEIDYETFLWMDDGKSLVDAHDRYEGICINHRWFPRGDLSLSEYLAQIRIPLENELAEQKIETADS
jgi:hypothetical protein